METQIKTCQNCKNEFVIESDDFLFYEKIGVPSPTLCPECRFQRRMAFRNERTLYKRKCDLCGEIKVSYYSPSYSGPVYCQKCWWSDNWDALDYGADYDFEKNFFQQFLELRNRTPQMGLATSYSTMINSDFCHMATGLKNCYLLTNAGYDENCLYSSSIEHSKECVDMLSVVKCELCYELVECGGGCYKTMFSENCGDCRDVYFSKNLNDCSNCFGCVNLRHRKYFIFNEPYSKDEYFKKIEEIGVNKYSNVEKMKNLAREFWLKYPVKYINGSKNVNVSGDNIYNSKNAINCYIAIGAENVKHCQYIPTSPISDSCDYTEWGENASLIYESAMIGQNVNNIKFCVQSWQNCENLEYSTLCISSSNLFGCVSLRYKEYCILNKQYSKEDYEKLREKIIKQMDSMPYVDKKGRVYKYGEFFPTEFSPFGYNETTAQEFFPLSESEIKERGYNFTDIELYKGKYTSTIKAENLPDDINDINEDILKEIIECKNCKKPYKIIKQELDFYKKENIALPRFCYDCRYTERFHRRNLPKLYKRKCGCAGEFSENKIYQNTAKHFHGIEHCLNEFETTYSPERKEIVYCEVCYNSEVA